MEWTEGDFFSTKLQQCCYYKRKSQNTFSPLVTEYVPDLCYKNIQVQLLQTCHFIASLSTLSHIITNR